MSKFKTFLNWSSGKDSALALHHLRQHTEYEVNQLFTTINRKYNRVTMHGLRKELLEAQLQSVGLPHSLMELSEQPEMLEYETELNKHISYLKNVGFTHAAYGDIFLEDLRIYREQHLEELGMKAVFPLWQKDTTELLREFLELGFKAVVVASKSDLLDQSFCGRVLDDSFINDLPANVDPCGENGEFHTFCYEGPIFQTPIKFKIGETVLREYKSPNQNSSDDHDKQMGFWFCDLLPD